MTHKAFTYKSKKDFYRRLRLFAAAVILLAAWRFLLGPWLLRLNAHFSQSAEVVSVDNFYDESLGAYKGGTYSHSTLAYNTIKSHNNTQTIETSFTIKTPENVTLLSLARVYIVNRTTGRHIEGQGEKNRSGYLFAPRNLQPKQSFTYWHINYDAPAHMRYTSQEKIAGIVVYRYETHYEGEKVDQTDVLRNLPGVGVTKGIRLDPYLQLWVEPTSGRIVKYQDDTFAYYYDLKTDRKIEPWNHFTNTVSEASVLELVHAAKWERTKTQAVNAYVPFVLLLMVLWTLGGLLNIRGLVFRKLDRPGRLRFAGLGMVLGGSLVLMGWSLHIPVLTRVFVHSNAVNPLTAISIILLGMVILLGNRRGRVWTILLAILLLLIGGSRLFNGMGVLSWDPDLVLFRRSVLSSVVPARMALFTAFSVIVLALVPISSYFSISKKIRLPEILASSVIVLAVIDVLGQLFDSFELFNVPLFFSTAVFAAILFFLASLVLYVQYREKLDKNLSQLQWFFINGFIIVPSIITILFSSFLSLQIIKQSNNRFDAKVEQMNRAITNRMEIYTNALEGAEGYVSAVGLVNRTQWKDYIDKISIQKNYPGIQGIGYSVLLKPAEREKLIGNVRAQGFTNFDIWPSGKRDMYSAVLYLEPFDAKNQRAFGYDMLQEPVRGEAMARARDSGKPAISGKVVLLQNTEDHQPGFILYVPYYKKVDLAHATTEVKKDAIEGYVYSPFVAKDFVEGAIGKGGENQIGLAIYDGVQASENNILYDDMAKLESLKATDFTSSKTIYTAGRAWTLVYRADNEYGKEMYATVVMHVVIAVGVMVSLSLSFAFYAQSNARRKAEEYANQVNADLKKSKARLQTELQETERLNSFMVDRELRMVELKDEIKRLKGGPK